MSITVQHQHQHSELQSVPEARNSKNALYLYTMPADHVEAFWDGIQEKEKACCRHCSAAIFTPGNKAQDFLWLSEEIFYWFFVTGICDVWDTRTRIYNFSTLLAAKGSIVCERCLKSGYDTCEICPNGFEERQRDQNAYLKVEAVFKGDTRTHYHPKH